jgi:hypothetical protein
MRLKIWDRIRLWRFTQVPVAPPPLDDARSTSQTRARVTSGQLRYSNSCLNTFELLSGYS